MKKIIIILVFVGIVGSAFSLGVADVTANKVANVVNDEGTQTQSFLIEIGYNLGKTEVTITPQNGNVLYSVLSIDGEFYNPFLTGDDREEIDGGNAILNLAHGDSVQKTLVYKNIQQIVETQYSTGSLSAELSEAQKKSWGRPKEDAKITISWRQYYAEKDYELLLIMEDDSYERIQFKIQPEFFIGENELFSKVTSDSYDKKALAFLNTFWPDDDLSFTQYIKDLNIVMTDTDWSLFDSIDVAEMILYRESFKSSFVKHFRYTIEEMIRDGILVRLPYLDFSSSSFDELYTTDRNIYIYHYLQYIFKLGKPVLSYILGKELRSAIGLSDSMKHYNWNEYEPISKTDGINLAKSALRYYTWGVEYTPFNDNSVYSYKDSNRLIYGRESQLTELVDNWVSSDGDHLGSEYNYLPDNIIPHDNFIGDDKVDSTEIEKVHNLAGYWKGASLNIYVPLSSGTQFDLSRIDLFTSRNFAYDRSRILKTSSNTGSNSDAINDGTIYLNDEERNFHAVRGDNSEISVGYEFVTPESIGGIVFVVGKGSPGTAKGRPKFNDFKLWNVQVKDYLGNWKYVFDSVAETKMNADGIEEIIIPDYTNQENCLALPATNYREFSYLHQIKKDAENNDIVSKVYWDYYNVPGRSLGVKDGDGADSFTKESTQNQYVYISFPDGLEDCYGIRIVDRNSGNIFLNIAEMMVFNEDPIEYLSNYAPVDGGAVDVSRIYEDEPIVVTGDWDEGIDLEGSLLDNQFFSKGVTIIPDENKAVATISINYSKEFDFKNIIMWEKLHNEGISQLVREPVIMGSANPLFNSEYFDLRAFEQIVDLDKAVKDSIRSPFLIGYGGKYTVLGNPLPFASKGIDSPRTFAYKMVEQVKARDWYINELIEKPFLGDMIERFPIRKTTFAEDSAKDRNFNESYVNEIDISYAFNNGIKRLLLGEDKLYTNGAATIVSNVKPFLPGKWINNKDGYISEYNSPYQVDKVAGVDSLGMLIGSIAMTQGLNIYNNFDEDIAEELNGFYEMKSQKPGLDATGKPIFYANEDGESYLDGNYRFLKSDLERSTVLVPEINLIRVGDILVRNDLEGDSHIGIVVDILADESEYPQTGGDSTAFMNKIVVLSVRQGFQMVSLGTWGNDGGIFGGFSDEPKAYQVRRLLKLKADGDIDNPYEDDPWEVVMDVPVKVRHHYPERDNVPSRYWPNNINDKDSFIAAVENNLRFYRQLPATSFRNKAKVALLRSEEILITCLSGFRTDGYHRGVDFAADTLSAAEKQDLKDTGSCDNTDAHILAPEDGLFYVFKTESFGDYTDVDNKIKIPKAGGGYEVTTLSTYRESHYGFIGVLITNPLNARNGRIYAIAHMGSSSGEFRGGQWVNTEDGDSHLQVQYADTYKDLYGIYPDSVENAIKVKAGDWIGWEGNRGRSTGPHIHLEVWEYFSDTPNSDSEGWERVDPLSCFDESLFMGSVIVDSITYNRSKYNWWKSVSGRMANLTTRLTENVTTPIGLPAEKTWLGLAFWMDIAYYTTINNHFIHPDRDRPNWFYEFFILDANN